MRSFLVIPLICLAFFALAATSAFAAGTNAGTAISSQATVQFRSGAATVTLTTSSNFLVDRKINFAVTSANVSYISTAPGAISQVLTFTVTNTGNTAQDFSLSSAHSADPFGGTDNFDVTNVRIYVENGATPGYQAVQDTETFIDELAADAGRTVYIVSDIPAGRVNGDISAIALIATAHAGGNTGVLGAALTQTTAADTPGAVDTVFADAAGVADGARDAAHSAASAYRVISGASVSLVKSAVVSDPYGGSRPQTGATVRYTISVTAAGTGTASNVTVTDPIPANTTFRPGTLRLNALPLTDAADADRGDVNATTPGAVTVRLNDMTSAAPAQTITFEVTIN